MDATQLIILALFGAIALGKWLLENAGKPPEDSGGTDRRSDEEAMGPGMPRHRQAIPPRGESEEEKMRRFMVALGLPAGEEPPRPPQPVQPPLRSPVSERFPEPPAPRVERAPEPAVPPAPPRRIRPSQTPMGGPNPWGMNRPKPARPPQPKRLPQPPVLEPASVFKTPEPEEIPLSVPLSVSMPSIESESASVQAVAPQMEVSSSFGQAATGQSSAASLLPKLRNRNALREALVLREILGPPKALQGL